MIDKSKLQSAISKYYLDMNERVIWKIENKVLTIDFVSPSKDVLGTIVWTGFDVENSELPIYDTKKLQNLINICDENIDFNLDEDQTKIHLSDSKFNSIYPLSDALLIPNTGKAKDKEWDVKIILSQLDVENMIKAKKALTDIDHMIVRTSCDENNKTTLDFIFGETSDHNNKVIYTKKSEIDSPLAFELPFNSEYLRAILNANKDVESGKIFINKKGLMKIEFNSKEISSVYYMVRKQEAEF